MFSRGAPDGRPGAARLSFLLNGRQVASAADPRTRLLDFLRRDAGLTGAKDACRDGDCGACTVALSDGAGRFRAVNSCLLPLGRAHGRHVVTVEGLAGDARLHPIQQALLDNHAVQCGYCTPGLVMSLFCLYASTPHPTDEEVDSALEGNLCRCTGYDAVRRAAESLRGCGAVLPPRLQVPCPDPEPLLADSYSAPRRLPELTRLLDGGRTILAGGTDLLAGDLPAAERFLDLSGVADLQSITADAEWLTIGAAATLSDIRASSLVAAHAPALVDCVGRMASSQVRNVATLAGNIANASPVADGAVLLLALGAEVSLLSARGERVLPLAGFFVDYRRTALEPGEIITAVRIPLPCGRVAFEKTGKRDAVDIASVNCALSVRVEDGRITVVRLAAGGVAPVPLLLPDTDTVALGRAAGRETALALADHAATGINPISDVRGSAAFRRELLRRQVLVLWERLFPEGR